MIQLLFVQVLLVFSYGFGMAGDTHGTRPKLENPDCRECHSHLVQSDVWHYPAEDACDNCHESTGASHPSPDSLGFRLMDALPGLCFYCHEDQSQMAFGHDPVVKGSCLACHDAHGSPRASLLLGEDQELCLGCHNREYGSEDSRTENISTRVKAKNSHVHTAISELGCRICHQAHGSGFRAILVDDYSAETYVPAGVESFALCFLCHDSDLLEAEESEWATGFRNGKQNLHWLHMQGNKGRNCRMCHNIHASPNSFLVQETVFFGNWEMELNFIPDDRGGSCLTGCHGRLSYQR